MLIHDMRKIGNKILALRKAMGLTQAETAEKAGLADRTYADIERGNVNMRIETLLRICEALSVTPDAILTDDAPTVLNGEEMLARLDTCTDSQKRTALELMNTYLSSFGK